MGDETTFSLADLARAAGMTTRNVRAYQTRGLLPPPLRVGRRSEYTTAHLERLTTIHRARAQGATLSLISDYLSRGDTVDLVTLGSASSSWAPAQRRGDATAIPNGFSRSYPVSANIVRLLRRRRVELGISAQSLADRCTEMGIIELSRGTIAKIEADLRMSLSVDEMVGILLALESFEKELPQDRASSLAKEPTLETLTEASRTMAERIKNPMS